VRIAIAGTHCSGKTTLAVDFVAAHPEYAHEPEPYEWLVDPADVPDATDFFQQLELSVERLRAYPPGARVVAERSPLDFVAYIAALDPAAADEALELAARGMEQLDLIAVLPMEEIEAPEDEAPELREAMHERLVELLEREERVRVVEVWGNRRERLAALERSMGAG
jgi:AAA domain